jgi:regulatory protein
MQLTYDIKSEDPRFLRLKLDGLFWREIYKPMFFKHLGFLSKCDDRSDFYRKWEEIEKKAAKEAALTLLSRKSYFSMELKKKLSLKKLSEPAIHFALQECQRLGYVNDEEEQKRFIEKEERLGRGPRLIALKLKARGMKGEVACDQQRAILRLLQTRFRKYSLKNLQDRRKIFLALLRRGFEPAQINSCLRT